MRYMIKLIVSLILATSLYAGDIYSTTGVDGYVNRFYNLVLNRTADQAGFDSWANSLNNQTLAGGDIAKGFFNSQEYTNRNLDNSTFVDICYRAFFGREADAGGKSYWINFLNKGTSKQTILDGFIGSLEFANLASSFGILTVMPVAPVTPPPVADITGTYTGTTSLTQGNLYNCEGTDSGALTVSQSGAAYGYTNSGLTIDGLVLSANKLSGTTSDGTVWLGTLNGNTITGTYNWHNQCIGTFSITKQ